MKKRLISPYTSVDLFYFFTLVVTIAAGGTAACSVLREQEILAGFIEGDILVLYGDMACSKMLRYFSSASARAQVVLFSAVMSRR